MMPLSKKKETNVEYLAVLAGEQVAAHAHGAVIGGAVEERVGAPRVLRGVSAPRARHRARDALAHHHGVRAAVEAHLLAQVPRKIGHLRRLYTKEHSMQIKASSLVGDTLNH